MLERLAARTRFESITASSAIENVVVDHDRALQAAPRPRHAVDGAFRDRSEARVRRLPRRDRRAPAQGAPDRSTVPLGPTGSTDC